MAFGYQSASDVFRDPVAIPVPQRGEPALGARN